MLILHRIHKAVKGPRKGKEVMVECIIKDGRKIAGAFTLLNPRDRFDLKFGLDKSCERAMRELKGRPDRNHTMPVVTEGAIRTIESCGFNVPESKVHTETKRKMLSKSCKIEKQFLTV